VTTRPPAQPGVALHVRLSRLPLPVLLAIMLVAGLCALLALNTASAAQELKQRSLNDSNTALSDLEQQLMRDLAAKQAPAALAAAAAAQGLVPNPNPAFLRLNADGSVTVLGSPAAASVAPPPAAPPAAAHPAATSRATPTKPAPSTSARPGSAASSPAPSRTASSRPAPTGSASRPASSRPPAPVVTVTVTRPAAAPTPSAAASTANSTAPGGQ
jgi:hypothetical protein